MRWIKTFVDNPVAANMLMIIILGGGLVAAFLTPRELFPEFSRDEIRVSVAYPGAPPADIEQSICLKIEDYVSSIEGVDEVSSTSREGLGSVSIEVDTSTDLRKVLDDVKSEIDKIEFPDNAEDPVIRESTIRRHVIQVAVFGEAPERTLREIAYDIKDDLTALPEISQVEVSGVREIEISIEIDEQTLRRYGLRMDEVAGIVRANSFDLPAGRIKTGGGEFALRIVGQKYTAPEYEAIPVLTQPDGTVLYLRDLATIRETFEDVDIRGLFNGKPAALVSVYKTPEEDTLAIADAVGAYIAHKQPDLPAGIALDTWSDLSRMVRDRLDMLVGNGIWGLVLVAGVLWLFLGIRLSFWVALGIPLSVLGTLMVMYFTGTTLNMMSMFAMIVALGLIVDDAIVVGENIYSYRERGELPKLAAVAGTQQVVWPVIGAVVTTWLAFLPLMFIPGVMGRFIRQMPWIVILALAFSLIECLTILPSHLAHSLTVIKQHKAHEQGNLGVLREFAAGVRRKIDTVIQDAIDFGFMRFYRLAVRYRYVTLTVCLAVVTVMAGAFAGGFIKQNIFPKVESDTLRASLILPTGTPAERTTEVARRISDAAMALNEQTETKTGEPLVQRVYTLLGQQGRRSRGQSGGHVADIIVELLPTERRGRKLRSEKITRLWRENAGRIPDALSLTFGAFRAGPGGTPLEVRVLAENTDDAKAVAEKVKDKLESFAGVSDIEDDALPGKMELQIVPRRKAYALGIDQQMLARQLRDAFYGNESIEIQRGRDEIKVMVRYPEEYRRSLGNIDDKRIRTPQGDEVPFNEVAEVTFKRGYSTLKRVEGKSVVTVSADIDEDLANAEDILTGLSRSGFFDEAVALSPGAKIDLEGQRQQRTESLGALKVWFPVALLGIYTILAAIFRSYLQPIIVMIAIPFGLIGAVIGHWLLGFDITLLSMFGMVALAGIVVNDSLVLIDLVNSEVRNGASVEDAARNGARGRFRPIILTTVTTVLGMSPLLLEPSFQAQFLKPMAVSITFGLMFATMLTLVVVPCLYLIGSDLRRVWHWVWTGRWPTAETVSKHAPDESGPAPETAAR
jgi:hydrophobic/amphiphilic exporter-1 (mainly G- bacteria), HAE1 family